MYRKESNSKKKCKNCFQKKNKFKYSSFEHLNNLKSELKNSSITNNQVPEKAINLISSSTKESYVEISGLNNLKNDSNIVFNEKANKNNITHNNEKNKYIYYSIFLIVIVSFDN